MECQLNNMMQGTNDGSIKVANITTNWENITIKARQKSIDAENALTL